MFKKLIDKLRFIIWRYFFWKKVRKNDFIDFNFYAKWSENNKLLNKSFKDEVLNEFDN